MRFDAAVLRSLVREPFLLLDLDGTIADANSAAGGALSLPRAELLGRALSSLCADPSAARGYLERCASTSGPTPGALRLGARARLFRCEGRRITASDGTAALAVTLRPTEEANQFLLLGQKIAELNDEIERRRRAEQTMAGLQALTAALVAARDPRQVAAVTVEQGTAAGGACAGALFLPAEEQDALLLEFEAGYPDPVVAYVQRVPLKRALPVAEAFRTREPIFVSSPEEYAARYPEVAAALADNQSAAFAVLPLMTASTCAGVLSFSYAEQREFSAWERRRLRSVAGLCAVALERARLYDTEREARERAMRAERRKDEFLAMLGHELRNPLAPIMTALELMRLGGRPVFEKERAVIERQTRHMVSLVDDLLDVSRVARGKIELRREPQELSLAIDRAVEMTAPLFEERRIRLTLSAPRRGLVIDADQGRIAQVVTNLLHNAAKYTAPGGEVELRAVRERGAALIRVRDSGKGIEPALLPHVFDMFDQAERSATSSSGGLGLGLAIVKSLVELHGGAVSAHSEGAGTGSEFTVRLPCLSEAAGVGEGDGGAAGAEAEAEAEGVRVLIVDDNDDAAQLLADGLAARGYLPHAVQDGPSALRAAESFQPDVAILDIGLPIMDGYELAARLRERPSTASVPLIALTAYGQENDRRRAKALGFDAHIVKPADLQALSEQILGALRSRGSRRSSKEAPS